MAIQEGGDWWFTPSVSFVASVSTRSLVALKAVVWFGAAQISFGSDLCVNVPLFGGGALVVGGWFGGH